MNGYMRTHIYILLVGLCLISQRAVAFSYEVHVPMHSSQSGYGSQSSYAGAAPAAYAMQSTSATRMSSVCRTSNDLAMLGNATGRFSTCVYGVGEEAPSANYNPPRPRRVGENDHSDDMPGDVTPVGDIPWWGLVAVLLLYGGYIAFRRRRKAKRQTEV